MCNKEYCLLCGSELLDTENKEKKRYEYFGDIFITCPLCGTYLLKEEDSNIFLKFRNETAYFLYKNKFLNIGISDENNQSYIKLIKKEKKDIHVKSLKNYVRYVTIDEIKSFYPYKFSEKMDNCKLALISKAEMPGNSIEFSIEELATICCVKRSYKDNGAFDYDKSFMQIKAILSYLKNQDYIDNDYLSPIDKPKFELKPNLWLEAEKLQLIDNSNKQVFVSMSFAKKTKNTREAIRRGIVEAGFIPYFIDEDVHNKQIVPYMLKQIRDSRFLIMETTDSNYGAYYEAGYAEGLGKQVIICCRKDAFDKKKGELIHFDIAQKQLLLWEDEKDLEVQLAKWIKTLLGSN